MLGWQVIISKEDSVGSHAGGTGALCCVRHTPRLLEMPFEQAFDVDGDFRKGTLAWRVASEGQCCCSVLSHL